ncbi:HAD-IA family hydrolase [Oceanicella actignis]|uniref:HAD-IA family hydrolase n=1 Tax=Oceanicella actignis TaxID=1189325 RepID=UPI0011E6530D|nr:HAD-IA family hydrolase [Oceanicella actignis]TYO91364.1 phosphoglycolate phosphatase [Oceanicella actignis]
MLLQNVAPARGAGRPRCAAFDLDGTLADTSADLLGAANAALAAAGRGAPLDPGRDQGLAGRGGRAMLTEGLARAGLDPRRAGAEAEALLPRFLALYEARIAERTRLFPGVAEALERLAAAGWALAVCTNKPQRLAELLLAELGLARRFAAVLGADALPVRKPDPEHLRQTVLRAGGALHSAALVGDTVTDRETARAAGVPCVLVDFGLSADDPRALGPEAIVRDFAALPATLERLVPAAGQGARNSS